MWFRFRSGDDDDDDDEGEESCFLVSVIAKMKVIVIVWGPS